MIVLVSRCFGISDTKVRKKASATTQVTPVSKGSAIIDMKAAVQTAMAFAKEMLPAARDIRLEEVEPTSGGWSVVISYAKSQSPTFAVLRGEEESRDYKKIAIESESGQAKSLKVWK